jgi:hypothetical protein
MTDFIAVFLGDNPIGLERINAKALDIIDPGLACLHIRATTRANVSRRHISAKEMTIRYGQT